MRSKLSDDEGQRKKFRAVFSRFGKKTNYQGYSESTVLLTKVIDIEKKIVVTDHAWFSLTKGFEEINLKPGMIIEFEARVKAYEKGYVNKRYGINQKKEDFRFSHPGKIVIIDPDKE
ncbi:hypothetical protein [Pseudochryseolinea flava]|uniref:DUF3127 domain-containing protein n=1 Tax=Pseudochryseolinea flava TaxID=2059302 RepID=A0A364Y0I9_9BACT|nr:hypothetical protein [Pseudochryseolinea flava]RAW00101.1 hypothetical protein DQQ10_16255 [Pseudochryseolinea flava]